MNISRTRDKKAISKILRHPKVFKWLGDDLSPDNYSPHTEDPIIYLIDENKTAVIRIDPMNGITCNVHIAATPKMWGKTQEFAETATGWLFKHTRFTKVIAMVPDFNRLAIRLAGKIGMQQEGIITKSFLKNWKAHDLVLFGLCKHSGGIENG